MEEKPAFISLADSKAMQELAVAYQENAPIVRAVANVGRTFENWTSNTSIKSDYNRSDYDYFRPSEAINASETEVIKYGMKVYDKVGIIRNIIDLMGDFTCKGIRLVHRDPRAQKFFREWFNHVRGQMVSERFCNLLYRIANVPVHITYANMPVSIADKWKSAYGINFESKKQESRKIPYKYSFLNPTTIEPILPELAMFTGKYLYAIRIGSILAKSLGELQGKYKGMDTSKIEAAIPEDIKELIKTGNSLIPVSEDNLNIYFYKKDDWCTWAKPMTYALLDDIIQLEKMKLADISALDGAISNVRLWRIGFIGDNPNNTLIPSPTMLAKLRSILAANVGGGVIDMVWGPELDFKESATQVHKYLGMEKYEPVLHNIYKGMGMPIGGSGTYSNNFLDMQTFIERLEYGRMVLCEFWNKEIKKVQEAMGYKTPAKVQFDKITVGDEIGMMKLIIELWDRGVIPDDMLQESFDYFPEIVSKKLQKEYKARVSKKIPPKAGPYFNYNVEDEFKKLFIQAGGVTPSELDIELSEKKAGETPVLDKTIESQEKIAKMKPKPVGGGTVKKYSPAKPNGRPKNAKDGQKRKKKVTKADSEFLAKFLWANAAQKQISDILTPGWVKDVCGKKDIRQLTTEEAEQFESIKFNALANLSPHTTITKDNISLAISPKIEDFTRLAKAFVYTFVRKNGRHPTLEEKRQIQASSYAMYFEEEQTDNTTEEILNTETINTLGVKNG